MYESYFVVESQARHIIWKTVHLFTLATCVGSHKGYIALCQLYIMSEDIFHSSLHCVDEELNSIKIWK